MIFAITVAAAVFASRATADSAAANISSDSLFENYSIRNRRNFPLASNTASDLADAASTVYSVLKNSFTNDTDGIGLSENASWVPDHDCELESDLPEDLGIAEKIFLVFILGVLIAIMIVGNILVILAIVMERELQRAQYYLVLSLAVADLMVGVVVSPLSALYDINRQWHLGVPMCDFWILSDVLACTSSILHLVAIALDR